MRRLLLNVHLYGGLLCSSYLLLYGLSSLHFNHDFAGAESPEASASWEETLELPTFENDEALAEYVRDQLGLSGWVAPWKISRSRAGVVRFEVSRPGKAFTVHITPASGEASIEERRLGLWHAIAGLHGLSEPIPGMREVSTLWSLFTEVTTWVLLLSAASGLYLWLSRRRQGAAGWVLLTSAAALSILLMAWVLAAG